DWVRAFDPAVKVEAIEAEVDGPDAVAELLDGLSPDVVMSGVDSPAGVDGWVDSACVSRGVPYVRGGMHVTQGLIWSVDPGVSACLGCFSDDGSTDEDEVRERAAIAMYGSKPRSNRGIGPVAGVLGALCAFEVLRSLTRFAPPAYAGRS